MGTIVRPVTVVRGIVRRAWGTVAIAWAALLLFAGAASALSPGDFDTTFGTAGVATQQFGTGTKPSTLPRAAAMQADGKIVTVGAAFAGNMVYVARFNADGSLDHSFADEGKLVHQFGTASQGGSELLGLAVQPDGKIVVGGWAADNAGDADLLLVRLNSDGSFDPTFGTGGVVTAPLGGGASGQQSAEASELALLPDGKILVVGDASSASGQPELLVARFNPDGSLDSSFGTDGRVLSSAATSATALTLQGDGKVVVSGQREISGYPEVMLTRFNADGSVDSSFASGGTLTTQLGCSACIQAESQIDALAAQPDGKILGAGFADGNAQDDSSLVIRLNRDGSFDANFGTGGELRDDMGQANSVVSPFSRLSSLALQANGKIVVAGIASDSNGNNAFLLARLTTQGGVDRSFGSGGTIISQLSATTPANSAITNVLLSDDGKVVMAGRVNDTASTTKLLLARLIVDLPPVASFTASPATARAGAPVSFAAGASADPDGTIAGYSWNFGDGSTAATAAPTHAFARPGTYAVKLTVTDDDGLSATTTQAVAVTGPAQTGGSSPRFSHVYETSRRWREGNRLIHVARKRRPPVGTTFGFTLNEPARVTLTFSHQLPGRRVGRQCAAPTPHNRLRPRCARMLAAGSLAFTGHVGANTVRFAGRISRHRKLAPGTYTLTITATDRAGHRAVTQLRFTIVKG